MSSPPEPSPPSPATLWGLRLFSASFVVLGLWIMTWDSIPVVSRAWQPDPNGPGEIPVVLQFTGAAQAMLGIATVCFGVGLLLVVQQAQRWWGMGAVLLAIVLMLVSFVLVYR